LCAYRNVLGDADLERARPFHDLLLEANPEQLVWGSDWPHLRVTPEPDAGQLLETFKQWSGSDTAVRQVLQDNPTRLYD
jgi:predicted TIM-barrel fold metal-dependent hydrolase